MVITLFCRKLGGAGGVARQMMPAPHPIPQRVLDATIACPTRPDQPLLYRLSAGRNPVNADPAAAKAAGFDRPIMHGHCTLGIACRAILQNFCGYDPVRMRSLAARYTAIVYPGDCLTMRFWQDGPVVTFECDVEDRGVTVMKNGYCLTAM